MSETKPTMLLSNVKVGEVPSFQLIAIDKDCPYVEGLYVPQDNALVLLHANKKVKYHFVPRLNEEGEMIPVKNKQGKFKEQREKIEMFHEVYLYEPGDIEAFVKIVAVNSTTFNFKKFLQSQKKSK